MPDGYRLTQNIIGARVYRVKGFHRDNFPMGRMGYIGHCAKCKKSFETRKQLATHMHYAHKGSSK